MDRSGRFIVAVDFEETSNVVRITAVFFFLWCVVALAFNLMGGY